MSSTEDKLNAVLSWTQACGGASLGYLLPQVVEQGRVEVLGARYALHQELQVLVGEEVLEH
eukprot:9023-Eustigmatos_ZCMA.PRE.1